MRSERLTGIEAGRGVAALLVVCLHARDHLLKASGHAPFGELFAFGHAGVDFFFVLSGFIILHVHAEDVGRPVRLGHYLRRRFTRIYPFYWVALAAGLAAIAASGHDIWPTAARIASSALLLPMDQWPVLSVAWTLQHEMVFYVAFAALIVDRRLGFAVLGLWFALLLWSLATSSDEGGPVLGAFNLHFFFGLAAAWLLRRARVPVPFAALIAGVSIFAAVAAAEDAAWLTGASHATHLGYAAGSAVAILGLVEAERRGMLRVPGFMVALGGASYAIYLTHLLCIGAIWQAMLAAHVADAWPVGAEFLVLAGGATLLGWAISRGVERPVVALARHLTSMTRPRWLARRPRPGPLPDGEAASGEGLDVSAGLGGKALP